MNNLVNSSIVANYQILSNIDSDDLYKGACDNEDCQESTNQKFDQRRKRKKAPYILESMHPEWKEKTVRRQTRKKNTVKKSRQQKNVDCELDLPLSISRKGGSKKWEPIRGKSNNGDTPW